jgi:hypothetical protein
MLLTDASAPVAATVQDWKALDFLAGALQISILVVPTHGAEGGRVRLDVGGADVVPRKIPASVLLRQLQEQQLQQQAKAATNGLLHRLSVISCPAYASTFRSVTIC